MNPNLHYHVSFLSIGMLLCILPTEGDGAIQFSNLQFLSGTGSGDEVLNVTTVVSLNNTATSYDILTDSLDPAVKRTAANQPIAADLADVSLVGISSGTGASLSLRTNSRIQANHGFTGAPSSDNPGTLLSNVMRLTFADHLLVSDASFTFSSLNTAGISWEYSVIRFLDQSGNYLSNLSNVGWSLGVSSQYLTAALTSGFTGQAGVGNYVLASTGTVSGVGGGQTSSGSSGSGDNFTATYANMGLAAGSIIGGIEWTTYLEDVRGTANGNSNFTASLLDFTISGTLIPEPTSALLSGLGLLLVVSMRRR